MADQATLDAIETAELILQVDTGRPAADPFKLPAPLQTLLTTRLSTCKGKNAAATIMEGSTVGAAQQRQQALDRLSELLHSGITSSRRSTATISPTPNAPRCLRPTGGSRD